MKSPHLYCTAKCIHSADCGRHPIQIVTIWELHTFTVMNSCCYVHCKYVLTKPKYVSYQLLWCVEAVVLSGFWNKIIKVVSLNVMFLVDEHRELLVCLSLVMMSFD